MEALTEGNVQPRRPSGHPGGRFVLSAHQGVHTLTFVELNKTGKQRRLGVRYCLPLQI